MWNILEVLNWVGFVPDNVRDLDAPRSGNGSGFFSSKLGECGDTLPWELESDDGENAGIGKAHCCPNGLVLMVLSLLLQFRLGVSSVSSPESVTDTFNVRAEERIGVGIIASISNIS